MFRNEEQGWDSNDDIHELIGRGLAGLDRGEGIRGNISRARLQEKKEDWLSRTARAAPVGESGTGAKPESR